MIVWSGRGFLLIIILLGTLFLGLKIIPNEYQDYSSVIAAFITAMFSWYFGNKWNKDNERIVVDEKTGQRLKIKNNHSLFWIPMQYWGIIFSTFGIIILFQNSVLFGIIFSLILIALVVIPLINRNPKEIPKEIVVRKSNFKTNKEIIETEKETIDEAELIRVRKEKEDPNRFMPK